MKLLMFSVYDKAVKAYMQPFFSRSRGEALRSFVDACNDEKRDLKKHATDFTLHYLGEWDDGSGISSPVDPERIISASECLRDVDPFTPENRVAS